MASSLPTVTVALVEMSDDERAMWLPRSWANYEAERVRAGETTEQAARVASAQRGATFPGGRAATGHHVLHVVADDARVGWVWIGPSPGSEEGTLFLYEIEIDEPHRDVGLGSAAMRAAEELARTLGASRLALNVFGHNVRAKSLYDRIGYVTPATSMHKEL
jgi:ribosomal protein S18 acetylase RimI-like enzyme